MYDPSIIQAHAAALYQQAETLVRNLATLGAFIGAGVGFAAGYGLGFAGTPFPAAVGAGAAVIGALLGGWAGFAHARERAFLLRLEAQRALVLVQIEENTRAQVYALQQRAQGYTAR